ncbi:hypothetical protein [Aeromicrobium sp.]|uniref:hypothetical protein n=1 Tax=Aeromicrobium sp. TaxID=1871063 RepID=UPI003D6A1B43
MAVDKDSLTRNEQGVLAAGALALVLSLLPWFTMVTFDGPGQDISTTAWTSFATIGMVLLLGASAFVAIMAISDEALPKVVPWHLIAVVMAAAGTLLIVLKVLTTGSSAPGVNAGPGWSGLLLVAVAIVLTFFSVQAFRESEDELNRSEA